MVSVGVMFVTQAIIRIIIGPSDRRFLDGEKFILKATEFKEITGLNEVDDSVVFHAGTSSDNDKIVTNGGRVVSVVSSGKTMKEGLKKSYKSIDKINFEGKTFRQDIGFDL